MLLERLQLLGDGSADTARRRERAAAVEARAQRERRAQWVCLRQGQAIIRHGFGKLDLGVIASIQVVVYFRRSSPDPSHSNRYFHNRKVVKRSRHNLALVVLRILVWAKHLYARNSSWYNESAMRAYFTIKLGKQVARIHCIRK